MIGYFQQQTRQNSNELPPSITSQPTNQSVTEGSTATFNISADNATSYQWQLNTGSGWNDISGATSTSYTTGITLLTDSGDDYRCVVTGPGGVTNSDIATLTVNPSVASALVVVALGQSLNVHRGSTSVTGLGPAKSRMPIGGAGHEYFQYSAVNDEHVLVYDDVASVVQYNETGNLTGTLGGTMVGLDSTSFERIYGASVAIGSRDIYTLSGAGPKCNLQAVIFKLVDAARADGYTNIEVAFTMAHGESAMNNSRSEQEYYDTAFLYCRMAQMLAAQAIENPAYVAPIVFNHPQQNAFGQASYDVQEAIRRISKDIGNGINIGTAGVFDSDADRTHNTDNGQAHRGEVYGIVLNDFFTNANTMSPLEISSAVLTGTSVVVTFTEDIVDDSANFDYGENLNTAFAEKGFEWDDNGTPIAVDAVSITGSNQATLTLNSAPVGTLAQQTCIMASQATTATLTTGSDNRSGTPIRKAGSGVALTVGTAFTWHQFPIPQTFKNVQ